MTPITFSLADLRDALRHLYEPRALQASPLARGVALGSEVSTALALQQMLTEAIEGLRPTDEEPTLGLARRSYEVLHYRFLQQCSLDEVAGQVGLSRRHLKREQRKALEQLALALEAAHGWRFALGSSRTDEESPASTDHAEALPESPRPQAQGTSSLPAVLPDVLQLVQPVSERYRVRLMMQPMADLPPVSTEPVALRQMILSVLAAALRQATGGTLDIAAHVNGWCLEISFRATPGAPEAALSEAQDAANLDVAQQLAAPWGGRLEIAFPDGNFMATLSLPLARVVAVLAVDDHDEAIQLFQRYVTGTRFAVYAAHNADEALEVAQRIRPQIIVLDVMMPQVDGWELLGRLKAHPLTRETPVVACTMVAQEELALALGVSAFVRKPISREQFLRLLEDLAPDGEEPQPIDKPRSTDRGTSARRCAPA